MIKELPGCKEAASKASSRTLKDGHDINALSVFIVGLEALDVGAIPGTPGCVFLNVAKLPERHLGKSCLTPLDRRCCMVQQ